MSGGFCRELSIEAAEPLAGTAAHVRAWIALEHPALWEPEPLPASTLPSRVKTRLTELLERVPASRLQLIRQPERSRASAGETALFLAVAGDEGARVMRFELDRYEDLLALDLDRALRTGEHPEAVPVEELHLVCCHGKRDRCCARWGVGLYQSLSELAGEAVWQTTHLGGHRFAATMVSFPQGLCFGRLEAADARPLLEGLRGGEIFDLDRLRGTSALPRAAQVAEIDLRRRHADRALPAPTLLSLQEPSEGRWLVTLRDRHGQEQRLEVAEERLAAERPSSCGDAAKPVVALRART